MSTEQGEGLTPDSVLGRFVIGRRLAAGGMGEVYEALDTRLNRRIALKVVHHDVAADPARRQRLEREARLAATLSHPHIVTLYSLEEHGEQLFLTMEFIDGATLTECIPPGGLPIDRFLELGVQLADGLAAAHAAGIIHRDLKPANVMIARDGVLKILDFGLSKHEVERAVASVKTDTLSSDGSLLGTAPYMAPEVIEGGEADTRSDIFSLGIVLFEMATGERPFEGRTPLAVITAILRDRARLASDVRPDLPPGLVRLIDRCLARSPEERRQSAADLRADLEDLASLREASAAEDTRSASPAAPRERPSRAGSHRWMLPLTALIGFIALVLSGLALRRGLDSNGNVDDRRIVTFSLDLPANRVITTGFNSNVGISHDGRYVAFTPLGAPVIIRRLDDLEARPMDESDAAHFTRAPLFSPDGRSVLFVEGDSIFSAKRQIQKAARSGGPPQVLYDYDMFHAGDWAEDGWIYWTAQYPGGIVRMRDTGGAIEPVTQLDEGKQERSHRFAHLLPGGDAIIYTVAYDGISSYDDARIELFDLRTKERKTLLTGGTDAAYVSPGFLVYARAGKLLAAPFDLRKREVTGDSFDVLSGLMMSTNTGEADFAVSDRGDLAYVPGNVEGGARRLVWVDRSGREEPLPLQPASYLYPRLAPDGRFLAVEIEGPNHDFYVYDLSRGVLTKMTTDGESHDPVWFPDGKRLAFRSWLAGGMTMWTMPADRSTPASRLNPSGTRESPVSVSPDARFLSFDVKDLDSGDDARVLTLDSDPAEVVPIAQTRFGEGSAKFSPDGKWVAYSSDESGKAEVYVQAFPGPGPKLQISNGGGIDPVWRRNGGELYYRASGQMMVVTYTSSGGFRPSVPKVLWKDVYTAGNGASCGMPGVSSSNYDVTADGSRFLMVKDSGSTVAHKVVVVLNWASQLKERSQTRTAR